jgi:hypothetical protein
VPARPGASAGSGPLGPIGLPRVWFGALVRPGFVRPGLVRPRFVGPGLVIWRGWVAGRKPLQPLPQVVPLAPPQHGRVRVGTLAIAW